jgi:CRISPR/Cas system-associated endoribonuclease Cas2
MTSLQPQDCHQAQRLKRNIKRLIHDQHHSISPWWLISFHYRDHHSKEDQLLGDVADLKRKLHRIIFQSRDKTIKGAGEYPYHECCFSTKPATRARVSFTLT